VNPRLLPGSESDAAELHNPRQGAFDVVFGFSFRVYLGIFAWSCFYCYWVIFCVVGTYSISIYYWRIRI
jgi:hypothetical protein